MGLLAFFALAGPALAEQPVVTATQLVSYQKRKMLLRKINGRWWTDDDRQVYPPAKSGMFRFWEIDSKPGTCVFHHHRPFDVSRGESLRLWMTPDQVEAVFGQPNREFGPRGQGFWYYYGVDGTALEIRYMEGELGEAEYERGTKKTSVESIARELGGRSIYKVKAERASQKSAEWLRERKESHRAGPSSRGPQSSMTVVHQAAPRQAETPEPTPVPIKPAALAAVKLGQSREEVLLVLGRPASRFAVATSEGESEEFEYQLEDGRRIVIQLLNRKVTRLP